MTGSHIRGGVHNRVTRHLMVSSSERDAVPVSPLPIGILGEHLLFHTKELEEARDRIAAMYTRHRLDFLGRHRQLNTYFYHAPLLRSAVNCLGYGSDVVIDPGDLQNFFLIQTPVRGMTHAVCGDQAIHSDPEMSSILSPGVATRMKWHANCWQVQVQLDRSLVEQHLANTLERPLREPLLFRLGMDMRDPAGLAWWNTVRYVAEQAYLVAGLPHASAALRQLEELLVSSLLHLQPHNYSDLLRRREPCIAPRHVKRAEEYIADRYNENITIESLAAHCGVSPRTLYRGFQEFRHVSPMQHLKTIRLDMVNRMLRLADISDSVTRIALDAGFRQLGRFAVEYRRRFGESPSDTLKSRM